MITILLFICECVYVWMSCSIFYKVPINSNSDADFRMFTRIWKSLSFACYAVQFKILNIFRFKSKVIIIMNAFIFGEYLFVLCQDTINYINTVSFSKVL